MIDVAIWGQVLLSSQFGRDCRLFLRYDSADSLRLHGGYREAL